MHNLDGSDIDPSHIVMIASAKGQTLVSYVNEPGFESLAFPSWDNTGCAEAI